ncbi:hypothetical protein [Porphyromonas somerae]|uniref:hypothetical protein n=1 Tax=Porphyromonas somerae TaxID=322095 RepID=UPI002A83ED9B|nr:hypothetical protein [Porphyromonas somerae]MDY3884719.1 hypothetical protein [Porphyromonas somerae]
MMKRNSVTASNGRSRYVGRDFDLYFFADESGKLLDKKPESGTKVYKMVASTNCSFSSNATFETVVDKSTPKAGVKELQTIDWSFQSDNNVANIDDLKSLLKAHKAGTKIYVILCHTNNGDSEPVDVNGSAEEWDSGFAVASGLCVIQSCTLNAQDGSLATFSMTLEGSGNYEVGA